MAQGASVRVFHCCRFIACCLAILSVRPHSTNSYSTVLHQVTLGLPLLSFPFTTLVYSNFQTFCCMKNLGPLVLHQEESLLPPSIFPGCQSISCTLLYSWGERGTILVKYYAHEHNTMSLGRLEANTLTIRSLPLLKPMHYCTTHLFQLLNNCKYSK